MKKQEEYLSVAEKTIPIRLAPIRQRFAWYGARTRISEEEANMLEDATGRYPPFKLWGMR